MVSKNCIFSVLFIILPFAYSVSLLCIFITPTLLNNSVLTQTLCTVVNVDVNNRTTVVTDCSVHNGCNHISQRHMYMVINTHSFKQHYEGDNPDNNYDYYVNISSNWYSEYPTNINSVGDNMSCYYNKCLFGGDSKNSTLCHMVQDVVPQLVLSKYKINTNTQKTIAYSAGITIGFLFSLLFIICSTCDTCLTYIRKCKLCRKNKPQLKLSSRNYCDTVKDKIQLLEYIPSPV